MKYIFITVAAFLMIATSVGAGELESHDVTVGVEAEQTFSDDKTAQGYVVTIPFASYSLEFGIIGNTSFTLDSDLDFAIEKTEADDEAGKSFNLSLEPALDWNLTDSLTFSGSASFSFSHYKFGKGEDQNEEDADLPSEDDGNDWENAVDVSSSLTVEYSTMESDLPGISPWESFERGFEISAGYARQIYAKDAGEKADKLDHSIGFEAGYAYFRGASLFMLKPSFYLSKHLNDEVDESLEMECMLNAAKDLTTILTGTMDVTVNMVKPDSDTDMETELGVNIIALINRFEGLEISAGANYSTSLSEDESDPAYGVVLGIEYELYSKE